MQIDHNIILQAQSPSFGNPLDTAYKAMSMKQLSNKMKQQDAALNDQQAIQDIFKKNLVTDESGQTTINRKGVLSDLYKLNPTKAMEFEQGFSKADHESQLNNLEMRTKKAQVAKKLAWSIVDEPSYQQARIEGTKLGFPELPPVYDPNHVKMLQMSTLDAAEQLANKWKEVNNTWRSKEFGLKERATNQADKRLEIDAAKAKAQTQKGVGKMTDAQSKALGFGRRAMLADQMVNQISKGTNVSSISTQLKTALPKWMGDFRSPQEQSLATAKLAFVASVLRKESGAAVTPNEFEQYDKLYFPQIGDSQSTLDTKKVLRQNFIDTEKLTAGEAWRDPIPFKQNAAQSGKPKTVMQNGFTYTLNPKTGEYE